MRRYILYGFILVVFLIIDKVNYAPLELGFWYLLGTGVVILIFTSDLFYRSLIRDSSVRITMINDEAIAKTLTAIGPATMRCIGRCEAIVTKKGDTAWPAVGIYPNGGLDHHIFPDMAGGGKKGYAIIPDCGLIKYGDEDSPDNSHQAILFAPVRVHFERLPSEWRRILKRHSRFDPKTSPVFYHVPTKKIRKIRIPRQLIELTDDKLEDLLGTPTAREEDAQERIVHLENYIKDLMARRREELRTLGEEKKPGLGDKIKDIISGKKDEYDEER